MMVRYTRYPTALVVALLSVEVAIAQCESLNLRASRRAPRVDASFHRPDTSTYDPAHLPPTTEQNQLGASLSPSAHPERSFDAVRQAPTSVVPVVTRLRSAKTSMSTPRGISVFGGMETWFHHFQLQLTRHRRH